MKCPNCNSNVIGNMCRKCGLDMSLYDKAAKISLVLYNRGLEFANRDQLSDAIDSLIRSVEFDKRNVTARNLLGLCYFACGRINEALKEWVISSSYKKEDNPADYYLDIFQKNSRQIQRYDDSAQMYNQAIAALQQKSDDIAIIQLKKAVEYNANFIDALNLLSLCYLNLKDKSKASACIDRVLAIDTNNKTALSYFREVYPTRGYSELRTRIDYASKNDPAEKSSGKTIFGNKAGALIDKQIMTNLPISQFVSFVVGAVCMLAVFYILIMPSKTRAFDAQMAELQESSEKTATIYETTVKQKDDKIDSLQKELDTQAARSAELINELDVQERVQKINVANGYFLQNKYEDAVVYLQLIETAGLPSETIELYNYIIDTSYPLIEADYYSQGNKAYNARNYDEAKMFFEKSVNYSTSDSTTIANSYYFLGRIAEIDKDNELAKRYYENIINNYENSNYYSTAVSRLANLNLQ